MNFQIATLMAAFHLGLMLLRTAQHRGSMVAPARVDACGRWRAFAAAWPASRHLRCRTIL